MPADTAAPIAKSHELEVITEPNLIEAANQFEGRRFGVGDGVLRHPATWPKLINPFKPSWGEPYVEIAARMRAAVSRGRELAAGHTAVCVSHQLPIWTSRRNFEGKRMWHDPRQRQCGLASLTTLVFDGDELVELRYREPAGASDPTVTETVAKVLRDPDLAKKLADVGAEPGSLSGGEFGAYLHTEADKWGKLIKDAGVVIQ